jgi:hypothetical protein
MNRPDVDTYWQPTQMEYLDEGNLDENGDPYPFIGHFLYVSRLKSKFRKFSKSSSFLVRLKNGEKFSDFDQACIQIHRSLKWAPKLSGNSQTVVSF